MPGSGAGIATPAPAWRQHPLTPALPSATPRILTAPFSASQRTNGRPSWPEFGMATFISTAIGPRQDESSSRADLRFLGNWSRPAFYCASRDINIVGPLSNTGAHSDRQGLGSVTDFRVLLSSMNDWTALAAAFRRASCRPRSSRRPAHAGISSGRNDHGNHDDPKRARRRSKQIEATLRVEAAFIATVTSPVPDSNEIRSACGLLVLL
jgi:hypothetical protein